METEYNSERQRGKDSIKQTLRFFTSFTFISQFWLTLKQKELISKAESCMNA